MKPKIGAVIFELIVATASGAVGLFCVAGPADELIGWCQARSWQAVPATVVDTALKESHDAETTTYQVTARYRYVFNGQSHDGTQVGFSRGFDNIGSWQHDRYTRLMAAKGDGRPIEVWVDPKKPGRSVIDRNIRWSVIASLLPFATVFLLTSINGLWSVFRPPPKLERNASQIRSDARNRTRTLWTFALLWGMIAFPVAFAVVPELFGRLHAAISFSPPAHVPPSQPAP